MRGEEGMDIPPEVKRIMNDIRIMRIRGAGRIARAAARALMLASEEYQGRLIEEYMSYMEFIAQKLKETRPTAVSLPNAVNYVISRIRRAAKECASLDEIKSITRDAAESFINYSLSAVDKIGEIGARRIKDGDVVLTHCNSSAALSVIITAFKQGKDIEVLATETRPKFQGYITARVLRKEGIPVTLIPDSSVRYFMRDVDRVIVGADTVTANGAVVNKIGTSLIALAAHEARVRVFVAAETYKFSPATVLGELVIIEERDLTEVVPNEYLQEGPKVLIRNPAFDVTPPDYIDAIITEKGIIPPQAAILILQEEYGWVLEDYFIRGLNVSEE